MQYRFRPTLGPNVAAIICEIRRYWAILEKIVKIRDNIRRYWADIKQYRLYYMGISKEYSNVDISMGYSHYSSHSIPLLYIIVEDIHLV